MACFLFVKKINVSVYFYKSCFSNSCTIAATKNRCWQSCCDVPAVPETLTASLAAAEWPSFVGTVQSGVSCSGPQQLPQAPAATAGYEPELWVFYLVCWELSSPRHLAGELDLQVVYGRQGVACNNKFKVL